MRALSAKYILKYKNITIIIIYYFTNHIKPLPSLKCREIRNKCPIFKFLLLHFPKLNMKIHSHLYRINTFLRGTSMAPQPNKINLNYSRSSHLAPLFNQQIPYRMGGPIMVPITLIHPLQTPFSYHSLSP